MINLTKGNILKSDAEALVNTVNCVGVMGKGIAHQFKQKYPDNFTAYNRACKAGEVETGTMNVFETGMMLGPKYIINFPTKRHWKGNSKIEYIEDGMTALIEEIERLGITSIAVPPLGCGNGGLEWSEVHPIIEKAFHALPNVDVRLYPPLGAPDSDAMPVETKTPAMTRTRAVIVKLIEKYGVPGYRLSMLEIQKLAYFMQISGEDLKLEFSKGKFGPYSEKLNYPLQRIEGHFTRGYGDRSRSGRSQIHLIPGAVEDADRFLENHPDIQKRLERVNQLIDGFETPYSMELLATTHWVAAGTGTPAYDKNSVVEAVHSWSVRKKKLFKTKHIQIAWQRLHDQDWL